MGTVLIPRACPHAPSVRRLAAGSVGDEEAVALESHVSACGYCATVFDAETALLVDAIRQAPAPDREVDPVVRCLIERVELLLGAPAGLFTLNHERRTEAFRGLPAGAATVTGMHVTPPVPGNGRIESRLAEELKRLLAPAQTPDELGRLGVYRVLRVIGAGGMGMVFEAEDPRLARRVAIKVILPTSGGWREERRKRFFLEARAAAALDHDNVVPVYETDEDRGVPYLVMPLLKGESLGSRLEREPRPPVADVLRIGREIAAGLAAAHAAGLTHRDLKPENLWLEDRPGGPRVRILDFGLACWQGSPEALTGPGVLMGTPHFMAPEQARGERTDARTDLFSLGCVLYRMLTGRRPFDGPTVTAVLRALELHDPPEPRAVEPSVPAGLSKLVMRLMRKRPDGRPTSADEVIVALDELQGNASAAGRGTDRSTAAQTPPAHATKVRAAQNRAARFPRVAGRRRGLWAAGAAAAVLAVMATVILIIKTRDGDVVIILPGSTPPGAGPETPQDPAAAAQQLLDQGKFHEAMLWLARALERTRDDDLAAQRRLRLELFAAGPGRVPVRTFAHEDDVYGLTFSPDGNRLLTGCNDKLARIWDVEKGAVLRTFAKHSGTVTAVAYRPGGRQVATGELTADGKRAVVRRWDVETGALSGEPLPTAIEPPGGVIDLAFSPAGGELLVACRRSGAGTVELWNLRGVRPARTEVPYSGAEVTGVAFAPDGKAFFASGPRGVLSWDVDASACKPGRLFRDSELDNSVVAGLSFSRDGRKLAAGNWFGGASLWDVQTRQLLRRFQHGGTNDEQFAAAISPDGETLACGGPRRVISLHDLATGRPLGRALPVASTVRKLQFSPDGRWLAASCGKDHIGEVKVYRTPKAVPGDTRRIGLWVNVFTRMALTAEGKARDLAADEFERLQAELEEAGGDPSL